MHPYTDSDKALITYMSRRLQFLKDCKYEIERKFQEVNNEIIYEPKELNNESQSKIFNSLFERERRIVAPFRYTMLVGVYSFVEEAIELITKRKVTDYQNLIKEKKYQRKSGIKKPISILRDQQIIQENDFQSHLQPIYDFNSVRNCIVHSWGCINALDESKKETLERAIERINSSNSDKEEIIYCKKVEFLLFSDQVLPTAILAAERLVCKLTQACFGLPLTEIQKSDRIADEE
jgi:hypothetical protein